MPRLRLGDSADPGRAGVDHRTRHQRPFATAQPPPPAAPSRPAPAAAARIAAMGFAGSGGWLCRSILLQGIPPPSAPHNASNNRGSSAHEPRTVAGTTARSSFAHGLPPPSNCRRRRTRAVTQPSRALLAVDPQWTGRVGRRLSRCGKPPPSFLSPPLSSAGLRRSAQT